VLEQSIRSALHRQFASTSRPKHHVFEARSPTAKFKHLNAVANEPAVKKGISLLNFAGFGLATLCLLLPHAARSQAANASQAVDSPAAAQAGQEQPPAPAPEATDGRKKKEKRIKQPPPQRDIIWEGLVSYGNYNIFAIEDMTKLYTSGIEYDRNSWGRFIGARMDYVAEFLPFVLLVEPLKSDYYGNPRSPYRKLVPGIGFSPIGLNMMWRSDKKIKPYIQAKGGAVAFTQKVLSTAASYEDFSLQSGFGVQTPLTPRLDLRLGLWGDFHFSNAYITPSNPGTDVMNANWGLVYHLGQKKE